MRELIIFVLVFSLTTAYYLKGAKYKKMLQKDDIKIHYKKLFKGKFRDGLKLTRFEKDKFQNEFGRYKERSGTTVLDLISSINTANDVTLIEEGDIVPNDPNYDYKEQLGDGDKKKDNKGEKNSLDNLVKCWGSIVDGNFDLNKIRGKGKRDARRDRVYLWLNRIVPYEIDSSLSDSANIITDAMKKIQSKTCITFKEHTKEENWIKFVKLDGCWSSVGRTFWKKGFQEISLGTNCIYTGIIMHEILHSLGFWHEQSRPDRDKFVEIFWENIRADEMHNFKKYSHGVADMLKAPYDFDSIMHYGKYSFAKDSEKPTLVSITNSSVSMGQRNDLSKTDIFQLNELYDCKNQGTGWSNWSEYGPCDTNCNKDRSRFCMDPVDRKACPNPVSTSLLQWGVDTTKSKCPNAECYAPIDGHWNRWGSWGECSVSCDKGSQIRKRLCTDPTPKNGGKSCVGSYMSTQACQKRSCNAGLYDCSFEIAEEPSCLWMQDQTDNFDWRRHTGRTPSSSTGPDGDHTSGSGYYLYIESSAPAQTGWKARLSSKDMSASPRCMTFAYNMYGMSTGELNIYVKDKVGNVESVVFTKSGDQLKGWKEATFDISASNTYQLIIEGIRGDGFHGDIGIDDLSIKDGTCAGGNDKIQETTKSQLPVVQPVGCYYAKGYIDDKRIFPQFLNLRSSIVWERMKETLTEIIKKCSEYARNNNYEYFAIEYWGECWTGPTDQINYGRDGEADDCWPRKSENLGPHLVGMTHTTMVYKWV